MNRFIAALMAALIPSVSFAQPINPPVPQGTPGNIVSFGANRVAGDSTYAPSTMPVTATGGTAARTLAAWTGDVVNVVGLGADPTGVADSAPAFRAAMGSNRKVFVPPGSYLFKSTVTPPCCAFDNPAVLAQGFSNFEIDGYGATIIVDPSIALSSAFQFDSDKHFQVKGLTIQGTRSGLTAGQENVGITLSSDVDFVVRDIHLSGNFGGVGAGLAGDWLVDGHIENIRMDAVGQCFDMAFLKQVAFKGIIGYGADTNGTFGAGQKCMSFINDTLNSATNNTGVSFTSTNGVIIRDNVATGFSTAAFVSTGTNYSFFGNNWHDNPGAGTAKGIGIYVYYQNGGSFTSVGVPPGNITVSGDIFANNGATVAGYGVLVDPSAITNSDVIGGVTVANSTFANNTNTGIGLVATAGFSGYSIGGDLFSGSAQTTSEDANTIASARLPANISTLSTSGTITMPNNVSFQIKDGSGNAQPVLFVDPSNEMVLAPASGTADVNITNSAFSSIIRAWTDHVEFDRHLQSNSTNLTATSLSACGTTPAINAQATDTKGTITEGTTSTGCTLTFSAAYATAPDCTVTSPNGAALTGYSSTTTALTITNASALGNKYSYVCVQ